MPTQELLGMIAMWRKRAAIWKRCAKRLRWRVAASAENADQLDRSFKNACRAADKAEAELAALKMDAWICADWCTLNGPEYAREAANRILEATKEKS